MSGKKFLFLGQTVIFLENFFRLLSKMPSVRLWLLQVGFYELLMSDPALMWKLILVFARNFSRSRQFSYDFSRANKGRSLSWNTRNGPRERFDAGRRKVFNQFLG